MYYARHWNNFKFRVVTTALLTETLIQQCIVHFLHLHFFDVTFVFSLKSACYISNYNANYFRQRCYICNYNTQQNWFHVISK